jgi:predicted transcriptional regulator
LVPSPGLPRYRGKIRYPVTVNRNAFREEPLRTILRNNPGAGMKQKTVQYFTKEEEEFANLLTDIGLKKNVSILLVFLAGTPEATSREIERRCDMRQPEVSLAMRYLTDKEWVKVCENSPTRGRPQKKYSLAVPMKNILASIEGKKKRDTDTQLGLVRKMKGYF